MDDPEGRELRDSFWNILENIIASGLRFSESSPFTDRISAIPKRRDRASDALSIFASKGTSVKKNLSTRPNEVQHRAVAQDRVMESSIERKSEKGREHTVGSHDFLATWYLVRQYKSSGGDDGGGPVIYNAITLVFTAVSNQGDNLVTN
ncbi:hypothetical protein K0M31_012507 [Melipona bicolor]|uniref:Uncharacterized protein n=1 Tax=Melipona bicolor TaxID=60889 RepID=A0AA40FKI2_9HYME|nr:hypothetical protein K0M31_012507 [Melipona bicolor]